MSLTLTNPQPEVQIGIDPEYVPEVVKCTFAHGFAAVTDKVAVYEVGDPDNVNAAAARGEEGARLTLPCIELEFTQGQIFREEVGAPGSNMWEETGTFTYHIHVDKKARPELMRRIDRFVLNLFAGKVIHGVRFQEAGGVLMDYEGSGLHVGQSRAINYHYEFEHT